MYGITYQLIVYMLVVSCLVRYSAAPPFAGCQMTANGVSRRGYVNMFKNKIDKYLVKAGYT